MMTFRLVWPSMAQKWDLPLNAVLFNWSTNVCFTWVWPSNSMMAFWSCDSSDIYEATVEDHVTQMMPKISSARAHTRIYVYTCISVVPSRTWSTRLLSFAELVYTPRPSGPLCARPCGPEPGTDSHSTATEFPPASVLCCCWSCADWYCSVMLIAWEYGFVWLQTSTSVHPGLLSYWPLDVVLMCLACSAHNSIIV